MSKVLKNFDILTRAEWLATCYFCVTESWKFILFRIGSFKLPSMGHQFQKCDFCQVQFNFWANCAIFTALQVTACSSWPGFCKALWQILGTELRNVSFSTVYFYRSYSQAVRAKGPKRQLNNPPRIPREPVNPTRHIAHCNHLLQLKNHPESPRITQNHPESPRITCNHLE